MRTARAGWGATTVPVAGLALYAAVLVMVAARQGPGISVDSVYYAHGAESFAASGEVTAFGLPLTLWPPGYPMLLGSALRVGLDLETVVLLLNVLSVMAVVVLTCVLGRETLGSPRAGLVAAAVVALSSSTVRVFAMLWTEPLFTAITLGVLLLLVRAVRRRQVGWGLALGLGALVSVATTLRYVGIVLVPVVILGVLLALWRQSRRRALVLAVLAGATAVVGMVGLVLRNIALGVAPLGDRVEGGLPITNLVGHGLRALGRYVLPETGGLMPLGGDPQGATFVIVTALTIGLGVAVALLIAAGCWSALVHQRLDLGLLVAFVITWWAALAYSTMASAVDPPNERLLAPAFAPMIILAVAGARELSARTRASAGRARLGWRTLAVVSTGVASLALIAGTVVGVGATAGAARGGIGYNAVVVQSSPLAGALKGLPADAMIASSDPWLAWWVARNPTTTIYDAALAEKVRSGDVGYLAFFNQSTAPNRNPSALESEGMGLRLIENFPDGALYQGIPGTAAR